MHIETGTTNERLARSGIMVIALALFAAWFAMDGWYRYPIKSLECLQKDIKLTELPVPHPKLSMSDAHGPKDKLKPGTPKVEVMAILGKPIKKEPSPKGTSEHWHYIGQYGRLDLEVDSTQDPGLGKVLTYTWEQTPSDYRMEAVQQQKVFAIVCAVIALGGACWVIGIWRTRVVVDETGLIYNKRRIPWDAMTDLDASQYHAKGWLKLVYQDGERQRRFKLDSFKIDDFDGVIDALCRQKGFANPIPIDEAMDHPTSGNSTPSDRP